MNQTDSRSEQRPPLAAYVVSARFQQPIIGLTEFPEDINTARVSARGGCVSGVAQPPDSFTAMRCEAGGSRRRVLFRKAPLSFGRRFVHYFLGQALLPTCVLLVLSSISDAPWRITGEEEIRVQGRGVPSGPEIAEAEGDCIEGADTDRIVILRARNEHPLLFTKLERLQGCSPPGPRATDGRPLRGHRPGACHAGRACASRPRAPRTPSRAPW